MSAKKKKSTVIAYVNAKGGVGKTTISTSLSTLMTSRNDKRVLFIDADHQCNATSFFQLDGHDTQKTLFDLIEENKTEYTTAEVQEYIYPTHYRGVDLLPNSLDSSVIESEIIDRVRESPNPFILNDFFQGYVNETYDYVIIDTPPSLGMWPNLTLNSAHFVIVPVEVSSSRSLEGLNQAIKRIEAIQDVSNPDLKFLRILLNKVDKRKTSVKHVLDRISNLYGEHIAFSNTISNNDIFQISEIQKETVTRLKPQSHSASQLRELNKEIMDLVEKIEQNLNK